MGSRKRQTDKTLVYRGRCWRFGDNVAIDGDMMPLSFALARETRPDVLKDYVMTGLDPDFPKKACPGDVVIAGRRFAQGNPHIQGMIGLRGLGLGLLVESIPRGSFRNAINVGLPILTPCKEVISEVETGDEVEVDFCNGNFRNLTRGTEVKYPILPPALLEIVLAGGWEPGVRARLARKRSRCSVLG